MRFLSLLFALTFLFPSVGNLNAFAQVRPGQTFTGIAHVDEADEYEVVPVSDSLFDEAITVTLSDVYAPAFEQPYRDKAKNAARRLIEGDTVHVTVDETEAGGPFVIGRIQTQDGDLSKMLVSSGHVWARSSRLDSLELQAQRNERGLWSNPGPIPPWEFEKLYRAARVVEPDGYSCGDFGSGRYATAQFLFRYKNREQLDRDGDGIACEHEFDLPFPHNND